jgi:hypothetical protein
MLERAVATNGLKNMEALVAANLWFTLTTGDHNPVTINVDQVVSVRNAQPARDHVQKNVHCIIHTADGKFITVIETCVEVRHLLEEARK